MQDTILPNATKLILAIGLREYGIFYFDDFEVKVKNTKGWETIYFNAFVYKRAEIFPRFNLCTLVSIVILNAAVTAAATFPPHPRGT